MSSFISHRTVGQAEVQLGARRPVRSARLKVAKRVKPHDHEFTEIILILSGKVQHVTKNGSRSLGKGDVLIIPVGQVHAFEATQNLELINIYFLPEWFLPELELNETGHGILPIFFAASLFRQNRMHVVHEFRTDSPTIQQVARELREIEAGVNGAWSARWVTCCFLKVLLLLAEAYRSNVGAPGYALVTSRIWLAFAEIDRIAQHGEKLVLARLARELGCTRDHLTRIFRSETGQTPNAFYQARRLQFVCRKLLETRCTVAEAAHQFGYADEAHLCRLFRQRLKLTPSDYRRKFHH
jgi:AraC family L-rhamnose operon regulatory protein RhaS